MSKTRWILLAVIAATSLFAIPSAAQAACYSSTPASNYMFDSSADGDSGLSPELTALRVSIDNACNATFSYDVIGQSGPITFEFYAWFINTDNNNSTGSSSGFVGADHAVGLNYDGTTSLSRWNGSQFATVSAISRSGPFSVSTTLDSLFANSGTPITTAGGAFWSGVYDDYYDWVPEPGMAWLSVAPFFTGPPPPSVGTNGSAGCVVPGVKGLKLAAAKRRIRNAGCSVGATRKRTSRRYAGRVLKTSPGRGARLAASARVNIYVGKKPRSSASSASAASGSPDLSNARINQALERASR